MAISWIDKLDKWHRDSIGSRELTEGEVDDIILILAGQELDLGTITFQLFGSRLPSKFVNSGWFGLESWIIRNGLTTDEVDQIVNFLEMSLDIQNSEWDWIHGNQEFSENYYYKLRVIRVLALKYPSDTITKLISYHINPHVPWSNSVNSIMINVKVHTSINNFYQILKPNLIKQDTKQRLQGGLNPRLGYGGVKSEILQEDVRRNWKRDHVEGISMVWFFMINYKDDWPVVTSFLLNLFDDHQPDFKIQSLYLLQKFIQLNPHTLLKSGLYNEFKQAVKVCLSYIPNLTPQDISAIILELGYLTIIQLIELEPESKPLEYLDVINTNILSSVSHLSNRSSSDYPVLIILVDQLTVIIEKYLKTIVLASFTRINFSLNQLITNPFIIDDREFGLKLCTSCLVCQGILLDEFIKLGDEQGCALISSYSFDLLGAWLVLLQRLHKADINCPDLINSLKSNFKKLSQIKPLENDIQRIIEKDPNVQSAISHVIL